MGKKTPKVDDRQEWPKESKVLDAFQCINDRAGLRDTRKKCTVYTC